MRLKASSWRVSPCARCAAFSISLHVVDEIGVALAQTIEHEVRVAGDRREQVVEVVRDAAGEPADRLHLLRLPELVLEQLVLA